MICLSLFPRKISVETAYKRHVTCLFFHINFKPGNHTPLGMWRKGLFLQKNKKYLILLLSPEKFVILNMREHKLIKSAERRDTDASKRTGRDDIHKSKTVS